jgi:hypothetical protein
MIAIHIIMDAIYRNMNAMPENRHCWKDMTTRDVANGSGSAIQHGLR